MTLNNVYACLCVNEALLQAAGIADRCLYNVHTFPRTQIWRESPVFPVKGAGLFREHRGT